MNREKIIKGLEIQLDDLQKYADVDETITLTQEQAKDIIALLKEQDNCENCAIAIEDRQPIVRCKDCAHRPTIPDNYENGFNLNFPDYVCPCHCEDPYYSWYPKDDWFCGDGERKGQ